MNNLIERLKNGEILICDGAMGSELQKKGLKPGECPEEWNETHRKEVEEIHFSYLDAGADIILTNTFGGNRLKLKAYGRENKIREYNIAGVENARSAIESFRRTTNDERRTTVFIFGDIGPTGQIMESSGGTLKFEEAVEVFQEQIDFLIGVELSMGASGIDGIIFETFEDIEEIRAGIFAAKNVLIKNKISIPIIASMTFHPGTRGFRTIMGTDIETAVNELQKAGADVVGTNCGNGPAEVVEIIKEMRKFTKSRHSGSADLPLIAEPNAGVPALVDGKTVFPMGPEEMAKFIPALIEAGANIIGGCCGTTPEHIKKIVKIVHSS